MNFPKFGKIGFILFVSDAEKPYKYGISCAYLALIIKYAIIFPIKEIYWRWF